MANRFNIRVPLFNGAFAAGIAANAEAPINPADRLVLRYMAAADPWNCTIATIIHFLRDQNNAAMSESHRQICVAAIFCGIMTQTITRYEGVMDCSVDIDQAALPVEGDLTPEMRQVIADASVPAYLSRVSTLLCGAKINWYKENHHTGQGGAGGAYIRKCITQAFPEENMNGMLTLVHRISHWVSTRAVLTQLGVQNIIATEPVIHPVPAHAFTAATDAQLRIRSNPAGTARMSISYELFKRMLRSSASAFCPNLENVADLAQAHVRILANPAAHHIGAAYLVGAENVADYSDRLGDDYLGRAGAFGRVYMNNTTLMRSPHIANNAYQNANDYSADFENVLQRLRLAQMETRGGLNIGDADRGGVNGYLAAIEAFEVNRNEQIVRMLEAPVAGGEVARNG